MQKNMLDKFKNALDFKKKELNWKKMPWEMVDAYNYKRYNALDDDQRRIFFKNARRFIRMVKKRGVGCLYKSSVYCALGCQGWIKMLLFLSEVVPSKTGGCLLRPNCKKSRPGSRITVGLTHK